MKIKNKATGQVFEIANGALYPKNAYIEVKQTEIKEQPKVNPEPYIETPIPELDPKPEEKPTKKTKKRKSSKRSKKSKKTEE